MSALAIDALERIAGSPCREALVLRGSWLTALWVPVERPVADLDFLAIDPLTLDRTVEVVLGIFAGCAVTHEVIWAETESPGLRFCVEGSLQIDVGFDDPIVPPPEWIVPIGLSASQRILAVRPETMFGWKVHGLFELGYGKWTAKTLADLYLLYRHVPLDAALLIETIRIAFTSRGMSFEEAARLLDTNEWGRSRGSRRKWKRLRRNWSEPAYLPVELDEAVVVVRDAIRPAFSVLR